MRCWGQLGCCRLPFPSSRSPGAPDYAHLLSTYIPPTHPSYNIGCSLSTEECIPDLLQRPHSTTYCTLTRPEVPESQLTLFTYSYVCLPRTQTKRAQLRPDATTTAPLAASETCILRSTCIGYSDGYLLHVAIDVQANGSSSKFYLIHLTLFRPAVPHAWVHYLHARPFRH